MLQTFLIYLTNRLFLDRLPSTPIHTPTLSRIRTSTTLHPYAISITDVNYFTIGQVVTFKFLISHEVFPLAPHILHYVNSSPFLFLFFNRTYSHTSSGNTSESGAKGTRFLILATLSHFRLCNTIKLKCYWSSLNIVYSSPMNTVQSLSYTRTTQSSRSPTHDYEPLLTRPLAD